ncbi:DUF3313 family protein, partial [bacterium]|nr:DUF3313 family protein [bacterium]
KQARMEEALEVARYLEQRFKVTLNDAAPMKLKIVENPSGDTLVLELNLVELMPTNPGVNTIGTAAGLLVPGGGLLKFAGTGSIAFEGVLRDGVTNDVVAVFKDREQDKGGPFSVKDFEEYGHVRSIIDEWAMQYALLATKPLGTEVADSLPIALLPY